ncbi:MAG: hypothetical protein DRG83_05715 [Deltaproteobacteria bacterium]|nr:MAG: hypothetical protein DRG83_05715 [Deltaproteobacteria bacterium]
MLISGNVYQIIHVVLDVILLLLLMHIIRNKNRKDPLVPRDVIDTLEKTIEQTREINTQFETALSERKTIIEKLVGELDRKLQKANQAITKLEKIQGDTSGGFARNQSPATSNDIIKKILTHLDDGLSIDEICSKYNKPRGEVELIVRLYSQSKSHLRQHVNTS